MMRYGFVRGIGRRVPFGAGIVAMIVIVAWAMAWGDGAVHTPAAQAAPATATISVDADPALPGIQDSASQPISAPFVSVDVAVQNASQVGAFEFQLQFDSTSLEFSSYDIGSFLDVGGGTPFCQSIISEHAVRIGCNTTGRSSGASGDGLLATLRFKPLSVGTSCMLLGLVETSSVLGDPLSTTSKDGCLTITSLAATSVPTTSPSATATDTATTTPTATASAPAATAVATMTLEPSATPTAAATDTATPADTATSTITAAPDATASATPAPPLPTDTPTPGALTGCDRADADKDGRISARDAVAIVMQLVRNSHDLRYDVDGDGRLGVGDVIVDIRCIVRAAIDSARSHSLQRRPGRFP